MLSSDALNPAEPVWALQSQPAPPGPTPKTPLITKRIPMTETPNEATQLANALREVYRDPDPRTPRNQRLPACPGTFRELGVNADDAVRLADAVDLVYTILREYKDLPEVRTNALRDVLLAIQPPEFWAQLLQLPLEGSGIGLITAERQRQIGEEGFSANHDDQHEDRSLAKAAACFAYPGQIYVSETQTDKITFKDAWPEWDPKWDKRPKSPSTGAVLNIQTLAERKRMMIKAGALCAAELDRIQRKLDRLKKRSKPPACEVPSSDAIKAFQEMQTTGLPAEALREAHTLGVGAAEVIDDWEVVFCSVCTRIHRRTDACKGRAREGSKSGRMLEKLADTLCRLSDDGEAAIRLRAHPALLAQLFPGFEAAGVRYYNCEFHGKLLLESKQDMSAYKLSIDNAWTSTLALLDFQKILEENNADQPFPNLQHHTPVFCGTCNKMRRFDHECAPPFVEDTKQGRMRRSLKDKLHGLLRSGQRVCGLNGPDKLISELFPGRMGIQLGYYNCEFHGLLRLIREPSLVKNHLIIKLRDGTVYTFTFPEKACPGFAPDNDACTHCSHCGKSRADHGYLENGDLA